MKYRAAFFVALAGALATVTIILMLRSRPGSDEQPADRPPAAAVQTSERGSDGPAPIVSAAPSGRKEGDGSQVPLAFSGVVKFPGETRFILTDLGTRKSSAFLALGESFQGHQLTGFNAATEVLTVERGGQVLQLPLKMAHVKSGTAPPPRANRIEIRIAIAADGKLSTDGRALTFETFNLMLQDYGRTGSTLAVVVQQPSNPGPKIQEINRYISEAVGTSGAKKSSVRIVPAPTMK